MTDLRRSVNPSVNPLPNPSANPSRNPGLNNSNATAPCNATTTHLNSTQLQHHLKPRRGLEESKTNSVSSRYSNGPIGEGECRLEISR